MKAILFAFLSIICSTLGFHQIYSSIHAFINGSPWLASFEMASITPCFFAAFVTFKLFLEE